MKYDEKTEMHDLDQVFKNYYYLINGKPVKSKRSCCVRAIKLQDGVYSVKKCDVVARGLDEKVVGEQI